MSHNNLIQVCSDIHLETGDIKESDFKNILIKSAEILVLAGDIGSPFDKIYEQFILFCSSIFTKVLLITGNHEYYNYTICKTDNKIEEICLLYDNVIYLNNKIYEYDYNKSLLRPYNLFALPRLLETVLQSAHSRYHSISYKIHLFLLVVFYFLIRLFIY